MRFKFLLFLSLIATSSIAQVVVSSGSVVSIPAGVTVFTAGDFTNNGQIQNNGILTISGAWTNTGDYQPASGQVNFNGPQPQIINHNAQSFSRLTISGGGEKIFDADITIDNELNLQNGVLLSSHQSKLILSSGAVVTGGSAQSYVHGIVYSEGPGLKLFPLGIDSVYLPLTFTSVSGTSPLISVQVIQPNPDKVVNAGISSVSTLRYWKVSTISGTFLGSPVVLPLVNETFSSTDDLVVVQAKSLNDPFQNLGSLPVTGSVTSGSITSKDPAVLPVLAVGEQNINKDLIIYNAVTPGTDGKHDFFKIVNIEYYPDNSVTIINRWGDKVFEMTSYNNTDRNFNGDGNVSGLKGLTDGTYYYVIDKRNGEDKISGFLILKR